MELRAREHLLNFVLAYRICQDSCQCVTSSVFKKIFGRAVDGEKGGQTLIRLCALKRFNITHKNPVLTLIKNHEAPNQIKN